MHFRRGPLVLTAWLLFPLLGALFVVGAAVVAAELLVLRPFTWGSAVGLGICGLFGYRGFGLAQSTWATRRRMRGTYLEIGDAELRYRLRGDPPQAMPLNAVTEVVHQRKLIRTGPTFAFPEDVYFIRAGAEGFWFTAADIPRPRVAADAIASRAGVAVREVAAEEAEG